MRYMIATAGYSFEFVEGGRLQILNAEGKTSYLGTAWAEEIVNRLAL